MSALNQTINLQNPVQSWGSSTALSGSLTVNGTTYTPIISQPLSSTWTIGIPSTAAAGTYTYNPTNYSYPSQSALFKIGEGFEKDEERLASRFNDIVDDEMHFYPMIDSKKIEPLETIMKYIKSKKKFDITLTRVGYEIKIKGIVLKSIRNLLSKNSDTVIKVVFEYDDMIYDNTLLTLEEKRSIKVRELAKNIKKNVI